MASTPKAVQTFGKKKVRRNCVPLHPAWFTYPLLDRDRGRLRA
jgi:hypothetical protein